MILSYEAQLLAKSEIAEDILLLSFSYPTDPNWSYQAGQYMIFMIPQEDHPARRLYSIASPPSQKKSLDFIIEIVPGGIGSTHVKNMDVGDTLTLQGPAGIFTIKPSERDAIFLATGTGIAPIYSMIHTALHSKSETQNSPFALFWGLKTCKDIYYIDQLATLAKEHPNLYFRTCLSREPDLSKITPEHAAYALLGRVTKGLEDHTASLKLPISTFDYYLCGSKHVVEALREYLTEKEVPKEQVHFEKFT